MPRLPRFTAAIAAFCTLPMAAVAQAPSAAVRLANARLIALEDARFKAQIERDLAALDSAIASDAVYVHANGITQSKAEYLKDVEAGTSRYRNIEASERSVQVLGDTAVTHALVTLHVGTDRKIVARTTGVYVRRGGRWLVLAWQSTPVIATAPAPPQNAAPAR